ncbi:hypothetical protein [Providencia sneebia]|uniref:Putative secreted protein n=1 Tax=Providencia sneebia DSM 19967 TaxID=1141660 RepID=K8W4W4_9GAMM|nr:hypothetical protein [Providencia sneebia]EKT55643.1 putative secreted protein [Providencia sneebia DSM 19967]
MSGYILTGCDQASNELSESNLKSVLEHYYEDVCLIPTPVPKDTDKPFPAVIDLSKTGLFLPAEEVKATYQKYMNYYNALESVGLLNKEPIKNEVGEPNGYRYSLTDEGNKYLVNKGRRSFCAGNYKIDKIISIDPPIENRTKDEVIDEVEITFSYQVINIAPWVKDEPIVEAFPALQKSITNQQPKTKTLVLVNDEWQVIN